MCHRNINGVTNKGMGFNTSILDIDFIVSGELNWMDSAIAGDLLT